MPKKPKRYRSEREIIALIHQCHREANQCIIEAESLETLAKEYFKKPDMVDDAKFKMEQALTLRRRADRLIDTKARKLGECLAEFNTQTMPFLTDNTVKGV